MFLTGNLSRVRIRIPQLDKVYVMLNVNAREMNVLCKERFIENIDEVREYVTSKYCNNAVDDYVKSVGN